MIVIKNVKVIDPLNHRNEIGDVCLDNGIVTQIGSYEASESDTIIDGTSKILYPGFVDIHVHFRDPGQTYKEDIYTGSQAAAKGGYTHIVCMANTSPTIDNVEAFNEVQNRMNQLPVNVYQACCITKGMNGQELTDMKALKEHGCIFFTDDGKPIMDEALLEDAMKISKELNIPLSFHEEDPSYIGKAGVNDGPVSELLGFKGAHYMSEAVMVKRDIEFAKKTGACINIQHTSSKESVELVRNGKKEGINVHAEACPHHFTLTQDDVLRYGSLAKMNPPLRTEQDRLAICEGLKDGTIDIIATDHAPHSKEEKSRELTSCPSGIIGLETAYSLANQQLVRKGYLTEEQLIEKMAVNPAKLVGIKASIDLNKEANMVLVDPNEVYTVTSFASKSDNSPFKGWQLIGKVKMTFSKGQIVFEDK